MSQHCRCSITTMAMTIIYYLLASSCLAVFGSAIASQNANSTTRRDVPSSIISNNDLPERPTSTAPTNISSTNTVEYVEKAELSLIYCKLHVMTHKFLRITVFICGETFLFLPTANCRKPVYNVLHTSAKQQVAEIPHIRCYVFAGISRPKSTIRQ